MAHHWTETQLDLWYARFVTVEDSYSAVTDHGALTGLSDDDHPQYLLVANIDDTPVDAATTVPISSNWAYDLQNSGNSWVGIQNFDEDLRVESSAARHLRITSTSSSGAQGPLVILRHSNAGGASANNNELGELQYWGHDGTSYIQGAEIVCNIDGTVATNDLPTEMLFKVTPSGASTPELAVTIQPDKTMRLASLSGGGTLMVVTDNDGDLSTQAIPGGSGTVTSVAVSGSDGVQVDSGSPITTSGTIALGIDAATLRTHLGLVEASPGSFTNSGSDNITTSVATVGLDSEVLDPDTNYALSTGEITATTGGYFQISYSCPIADDGATGATRASVTAWVEEDAGSGTWTAIAQSYSQAYVREASGGSGVSAGFVALLTDGEAIRIRIIASDTTDVSTETGEAQLSIHRIRAT